MRLGFYAKVVINNQNNHLIMAGKTVKLMDTADRTFTLKSGEVINLKANTPLEVSETAARELKKEYKYLAVVK